MPKNEKSSILYAEDSNILRGIVSDELSERFPDASLEVFSSGEDLEERLGTGEQFSVAIADNTMPPGPKGIDLIRKYMGMFPDSTFILYSADDDLKDYVERMGAIFINKFSSNPLILFEEISRVLKKYNSAVNSLSSQ